jgi:four helix bundle protein
MATIKKFEELEVWKSARKLNLELNPHLSYFQEKKQFELCKQIDRSAGSIMDNIAEGFERDGNREFIQFLAIAKASSAEFRSQLYRALDRKLISEENFEKLSIDSKQIAAGIATFMRYLNNSEFKGTKFKK